MKLKIYCQMQKIYFLFIKIIKLLLILNLRVIKFNKHIEKLFKKSELQDNKMFMIHQLFQDVLLIIQTIFQVIFGQLLNNNYLQNSLQKKLKKVGIINIQHLCGQLEIHLIKFKIGLQDILKYILLDCKLKSFLKYNQENIFTKLMFQNRESLIQIWKDQDEIVKNKMIKNSISIIDQFDNSVFNNDNSIQNFKRKKLSQNEILFKLLLKLNDIVYEDRQELKQILYNQILEFRKLKKESVFVKSSISFNLKMALSFNHYFQNYFIAELQKLFAKQEIENFVEFNNKSTKKKKRKKRKKNKNKKQEDININKNSNKNIQSKNSLTQNSSQIFKEDNNKSNESKNQNEQQKNENINQQQQDSNNITNNQKSNNNNQQKTKKEEQYSTENSLKTKKIYEIQNNISNNNFYKNPNFKKSTDLNKDKSISPIKSYTKKISKIQSVKSKNNLQLTQDSSFDQEQQNWYVQAKKQKRNKRKKKKKNYKKPVKNQQQNQIKKVKTKKIQNIQVSKPMNYLTKLNKWNDKEIQTNQKEKFLFSEEDFENNKIHMILRQQIMKIIDQECNKVLLNLINKIKQISQSQEQGRKIIKQRLEKIIKDTTNKNENNKEISSQIYIQEYGSYATKILTPFSDMDIYIQFPYDIDKQYSVFILENINNNLKQQNFIKDSKSILTASIPVLKIIADPSIEFQNSNKTIESQNITVDLTINLNYLNLLNSSITTTDLLKNSNLIYKSFQKNQIFLKYLFYIKQLNNTYLGGLNSYGMSLMYIAFLEKFQIQNQENLFQILIQFFSFFAFTFDPDKMVIDLGYGMQYKYNSFINRNYYSTYNSQQIIVVDPTCIGFSNVTSTCSSWSIIQQMFKRIVINHQNIIEHIFQNIVKKDLKNLTEKQLEKDCLNLLKQKELCFQNIFECNEIFLNPTNFIQQQ